MAPRLGTRTATAAWAGLRQSGALVEVTLSSLPTATIDYTTGAITQTAETQALQGLLTAFRHAEVDGVRIAVGDRRLFFQESALDAVPTVRDTLIVNSATWEVIGTEDSGNQGFVVLHIRQIGEV